MKVNYVGLTNPATIGTAIIGGSGYSFGFTVGTTITPTPTTRIGIGYRSAINQKINGRWLSSASGFDPRSDQHPLNLPDLVTVGLRQGIGDRFTLLAGFEW